MRKQAKTMKQRIAAARAGKAGSAEGLRRACDALTEQPSANLQKVEAAAEPAQRRNTGLGAAVDALISRSGAAPIARDRREPAGAPALRGSPDGLRAAVDALITTDAKPAAGAGLHAAVSEMIGGNAATPPAARARAESPAHHEKPAAARGGRSLLDRLAPGLSQDQRVAAIMAGPGSDADRLAAMTLVAAEAGAGLAGGAS